VIQLLIAVVDPDDARRTARDILNGRQYRSSATPRPFRRQLSWIGDRVHGFFDWIGRGLTHVPSALALGRVGRAFQLVRILDDARSDLS